MKKILVILCIFAAANAVMTNPNDCIKKYKSEIETKLKTDKKLQQLSIDCMQKKENCQKLKEALSSAMEVETIVIGVWAGLASKNPGNSRHDFFMNIFLPSREGRKIFDDYAQELDVTSQRYPEEYECCFGKAERKGCEALAKMMKEKLKAYYEKAAEEVILELPKKN